MQNYFNKIICDYFLLNTRTRLVLKTSLILHVAQVVFISARHGVLVNFYILLPK